MKKLILLAILLAIAAISLSACADNADTTPLNESDTQTSNDEGYTFVPKEHSGLSFEVPNHFEETKSRDLYTTSHRNNKHETRIRIFSSDTGTTPASEWGVLNVWKNAAPKDKYETNAIIEMFGKKVVLFTREIKQQYNYNQIVEEFMFYNGAVLYTVTATYNDPNDIDSESIIEHFLDSLTLL